MDKIVDHVMASDVTASLLAVPPQASFHVVEFGTDSRITGLRSAADLNVWINGGYFVLKKEIFDVLHEDEDLVGDAFPRLSAVSKLEAIPHHGFWAPMDTLKERSMLEDLYRSGKRPWMDSTWVDTGTTLTTNESGTTRTFEVFRKGFAAGQVALGPNAANTNMYTIAVV